MIQARSSLKYYIFLLFALIAASSASFGAEKLPSQCALPDYPYVAQLPDYCGPASLTSVFRYWGLNTDQKTVGQAVFDRERQATHGGAMLLYARRKGLRAYSWNSSIQDLKKKLAQGVPVIVLQDSALTDKTGHFRVATGYDDAAGVVMIHDPYDPNNKSAPYSKFQTLWKRHGNWALLICPSDHDTFKKELDVNNPVVHLDLANAYYKQGEMELSKRESRTALTLDPVDYKARSLLSKANKAIGSRSINKKRVRN